LEGVLFMSELPLAAVDRIIRKSGAGRVSESAVKELAEVMEEYGIKIAQQAGQFSKHANRKTIIDEDIRLVLKQQQK